MKRNMKSICLMVLFLFALMPLKAEAKTVISEYETANLDYWEDKVETSVTFTTKKPMILVTPINVQVGYKEDYLSGRVESGGIRVILKNAKGETLQNDYQSLVKYYVDGSNYDTWFYSDNFVVPAGTYTYIFKNTTEERVRIKYRVLGYDTVANKASVKKSVKVRSGNWVTIGSISSNLMPYIKSFNSSKKSVVSDWDVTIGGKIRVWARKKGVSTVTIKLKNGKKYKTKVNVTAGDPNFYAATVGYNTRNNYFIVEIKNDSPSTLTIYRNKGEVQDVDYKAYDRSFKSKSSISIAPGKTKNVRFYLKGKPTWYDYSDFTLCSSFKYEGVKRSWHVWDEDSVYKRGKNWYGTYWNQSDYDYWIE